MTRVKLFIDFWNFQLDWNRLLGKDAKDDPIRIPWSDLLPQAICDAVETKRGEKTTYVGTHVYASVDPDGDAPLRKFLHVMESFAGYTLLVKERKEKKGSVRCRECREDFVSCPKCGQPIRRSVEKGIDTAIVTDMIQMAYDNVYDVALLGSADADLCPGVKFIFERMGKPVYNLWFRGGGHNLRNACYDHLVVEELLCALEVA